MSDSGASFVLLYYIGATVVVSIPAMPAIFALRRYIHRVAAPVPASLHALWAVKAGRGLLLGIVLFGATVLPALLAGRYSPASPGWEPFGRHWGESARLGPAGLLSTFILQAAYEELLFRGIALALFGLLLLWLLRLLAAANALAPRRQLSPHSWAGAGVTAAAVIAVAFAVSHAGNPAVSILALLNIALAGLLLGVVAWSDGDVWGAWGLHCAWNYAQALCGLPVSGLRVNPAGPITGAVPGLLTGGQFGPEASLSATVALAAALACTCWRLSRFARARATQPAAAAESVSQQV